MAKWDKHSRKWEPSFTSRLKQRDADMLKQQGKKRYVVTKPLSSIMNENKPWKEVLVNMLLREHFPNYKYLTYDEMIQLKLQGWEVVLAKPE